MNTLIKNTYRWFFTKQYFVLKSCWNPETSWEIMCREGEWPPSPPWTASILVSLCEATLFCPSEAAQWPTPDHGGYSGQLPSVPAWEGHSNLCVCVCVALWVACFICDRYLTGMCLGQVAGETLLGDWKRLDHSLSLPVFFRARSLSHSSLNLSGESSSLPPFIYCLETRRFLCLKIL